MFFDVFVFLKKSMYKCYKIILLLAVQRHHCECFGKSIISCLEKFSFNLILHAIYFYVISSTRYSGSTGLSAANTKYICIYIYTHKIAFCEITITKCQAQLFAYTRASFRITYEKSGHFCMIDFI